MTIRLVTDSACDLTEAEAEELAIEIVPLKIRFGDDEYVDRVELSVSDFYDTMATSEHLPSTAAPAPGDFEQTFRRLAEAGATEIICISLSMALSATGEAALNAARAVADVVPVTVFDSKSVSAGTATQIRAAAAGIGEGKTSDEIVALLEDLRDRTHVYGALDTLENLKKGGRIGGAQAMLGTMLSIKPCIDVSSGEVEEAGKQRTRKRAIGWLKGVLEGADNPTEVVAIHGNAPDIEEFLDALSSVIPRDQIRVTQLGAVVGAHGGPRVLGLTFLA